MMPTLDTPRLTRIFVTGGGYIDVAMTPREVDGMLGGALRQGSMFARLPIIEGEVYVAIPQITHWRARPAGQ